MMPHDIYAQAGYLSIVFTLEPGDLSPAGRPEGVGIAMNPPVFVQVGDDVRCGTDRVGAIENLVVAEAG